MVLREAAPLAVQPSSDPAHALPASTIHDVAVLSGLPVLTASRALRRGWSLDPGTIGLAKAAAAKLGYTLPPAAPLRQAGPVALVVPTATAWFFAEAAEAAREALADAGIDSFLLSLRQGPDGRPLCQELPVFARRFAGVILLGVDLGPRELELLEAGTPAVASVGLREAPWDNVGIDDESAARRATEHLLDLGHWNLALLAPRDQSLGTGPGMRARRRGYLKALAEHHIDHHPDFDLDTPPSISGGHASMNELISNRGLPTAVFAACDEIAFGALRALKEHGLSSPRDVSIIGIDDHPLSAFARLSTIGQPAADQGALSAMLLLEGLHGRAQNGHRNHVLPAPLIERRTTRRARV